jgi:hypothetical protein
MRLKLGDDAFGKSLDLRKMDAGRNFSFEKLLCFSMALEQADQTISKTLFGRFGQYQWVMKQKIWKRVFVLPIGKL